MLIKSDSLQFKYEKIQIKIMERTVFSATKPETEFVILKRGVTVQKRAEELFSVRSKPLIGGRLKEERQKVADAIFGILTENITINGREEKEFGKLAVSFSRLIASYCADAETGKPIIEISPDMKNVLDCFSGMLQEETKLAVEEGLPQPYFSLSKFSVYEIAAVKYKLKEHPDSIVRKNTGTILHAAINLSDLSIAEKLAKDAKSTRDRLAEKYAADPVVMKNLNTIIYVSLIRGNLGFAENLAKDAKSTRDRLAEKYTYDQVVMKNLNTIISASLIRGNLNFAGKLAKDAKSTRDRLAEKYAADPVVMKNLDTIISAALHRGNLGLAEKIAKDAKSTRDRLAEKYAYNSVVMKNLDTIISAALNRGNLGLAENLAEKISSSGSLAILRR
jgi:hypothetical protein